MLCVHRLPITMCIYHFAIPHITHHLSLYTAFIIRIFITLHIYCSLFTVRRNATRHCSHVPLIIHLITSHCGPDTKFRLRDYTRAIRKLLSP